MQKGLHIIIFLVLFSGLQAQVDKYRTGFTPPLDIPLYLSGNFGETRGGHFHTGIDIKTLGRTGLPVKAVGDGYVSRVYVSEGGYGKALYITHPNGFTSVYGHLEGFSPKIDAVVKDLQYKNEAFKLNHIFMEGELSVKQGEIIANSGNTGSSGGPHLHFEIRRTDTEHPVNPLHCGMPVKDDMRPQIVGIKVFPVSGKGAVNRKPEGHYYPAVFYANAYHLKSSPRITVSGEVGIGIETFDYLTGDWSKCGTYSADLYVDNILTFCWTIDSLSFDESRCINTVCDFKSKVDDHKWIYKMFRDEPNNIFSNYCNDNTGIINFEKPGTHTVKLIVHDAYGNRSDCEFKVLAERATIPHVQDNGIMQVAWDEGGTYADDSLQVIFPPKALFNTINFELKKESSADFWSQTYTVHKDNVAIFKTISIKMKPEETGDMKKLYIAGVGRSGKPEGFYGNTEADGWISGSTRSFGRYAIAKDTIAPEIRSLDVSDGHNIAWKKELRFKIKDDESGIASFRGEIDGKWILLDHEAKKDMLTYTFDPSRVEKGKDHTLFVKVEDNVGNVKVFLCSFTW
ncbi:M23 family metallopeptidase [Saccharicrinis sp. FJH2]|uniref:M23 family metallopeptidase n=1 Tax=Saccharicrinis sp. FJH65 TaxID=3344659 RepID=UPI0035F269DC